ncbi:MAG: hypothetical protein JWO85_1214 [Candidatus Eremiobacteraeota bacterium]|nr:hypothetical protein [Candidatus Eremiobacteraeota bacterium]
MLATPWVSPTAVTTIVDPYFNESEHVPDTDDGVTFHEICVPALTGFTVVEDVCVSSGEAGVGEPPPDMQIALHGTGPSAEPLTDALTRPMSTRQLIINWYVGKGFPAAHPLLFTAPVKSAQEVMRFGSDEHCAGVPAFQTKRPAVTSEQRPLHGTSWFAPGAASAADGRSTMIASTAMAMRRIIAPPPASRLPGA